MIIITSASIYLLINAQSTISNKRLTFTYASPESQGLENETIIELHETVQGFVDNEEIVGAEIVVIKNKKIVLHEALGWKNKENGIYLEKNTVFNLRSMTKPIIGTAIQRLIDENKINMETKVSEYIPGFVFGCGDKYRYHRCRPR